MSDSADGDRPPDGNGESRNWLVCEASGRTTPPGLTSDTGPLCFRVRPRMRTPGRHARAAAPDGPGSVPREHRHRFHFQTPHHIHPPAPPHVSFEPVLRAIPAVLPTHRLLVVEPSCIRRICRSPHDRQYPSAGNRGRHNGKSTARGPAPSRRATWRADRSYASGPRRHATRHRRSRRR